MESTVNITESEKKEFFKTLNFAKLLKKRSRVLLVEDDEEISYLLAQGLETYYDCSVDIAENPNEAINHLVDNQYDLVVLDWHLPFITGGETIDKAEKQLSLMPEYDEDLARKIIPVVMFTSSAKEECEQHYNRHFTYIGYVSKRKSFRDILESFRKYFRKIDVPIIVN